MFVTQRNFIKGSSTLYMFLILQLLIVTHMAPFEAQPELGSNIS